MIFNGSLSVSTLTTVERGYSIQLNGGGTITNGVTFYNTGSLAIGDQDTDSIMFTAGANTINCSNLSLAGIIATSETGDLFFNTDGGNITITANTELRFGSGVVQFTDALTDGINSYTLTLTEISSDGNIVFQDNININGLSISSGSYAVSLNGSSNTIDTYVAFNNSLTWFGSSVSDESVFTGGVTATAGQVCIIGTVATTNTTMTLGKTDDSSVVFLIGDATLKSGSGAILIGDIDDQSNSYTLTLQDAAAMGAVTFIDGSTVTFNTLTTAAAGYGINFYGMTIIDSDTNFLNTGSITLGNGGDTLIFTGGLSTTACAGGTNIGGTVRTAGQQIDLGAATLTSDSTIDSSNNGGSATGAAINIASMTGGNNELTLMSRNGTTTVSGAVSGVTTLYLHDDNANSTGSMIFNGTLSVNDLATTVQNYALALNAGGDIDNGCTFLNTGTLTIGDDKDDTTNFGNDLRTGAQPSVNIAGTITAGGNRLWIGYDGTTLRTVNITADSTITTSGNDDIVIGYANIADGATLNLGNGGGDSIGLASLAGVGNSTININTTDDFLVQGAFNLPNGTIMITNCAYSTLMSDVTVSQFTVSGCSEWLTLDGRLTATTLTLGAGGYNIKLYGGTDITNQCTFNNVGAIEIGDEELDVSNFTNGITATGNQIIALAGTVSTSGADINLGSSDPLQLTWMGMTNSGTLNSAGGNITLNGDAFFGDSKNLQLISDGGTITVTAPLASAFANLTLQRDNAAATGTVTFNTGVSAATLTTYGRNYALSLNASTTITNLCTFLNTGALSMTGGTFSFNGGVVAEAPSSITASGTIAAAGTGVITLGDAGTGLSVTDNLIVGGASTGLITLGAATVSADKTLTVGAGAATPLVLSSVTGPGNLTINTTGAGTVSGTVGTGTPVGAIAINNAAGLAFRDEILAVSYVQNNGQVTLSGTSIIILSGAFTMAGGTFDQGDSTLHSIEIDGKFTLSGGTFIQSPWYRDMDLGIVQGYLGINGDFEIGASANFIPDSIGAIAFLNRGLPSISKCQTAISILGI